jgi:hypothetical protein
MDLGLMCVVQISLNTFILIVELSFKGNILSLFYGIVTHCCTFGGSKS